MKVPKTREVMAESLTRMLMEGPEVSLSGSPTVSPTTAAACSGSFFLTCAYFFGINGVGHVVSSLLLGEVGVVGELSGSVTLLLESLDEVKEHTLFFGSGSVELTGFNHLLAVIPSTTSVGGGEGNLDSRDEDTSTGNMSEDESDKEGRDDDDGTGGDYLGERS